MNHAALERPHKAIEYYQRSRQHFASIGAGRMAVMVGDNLAQMYLKVGRAGEALALSQASLAQEEAAGRVSDALISRANIALEQAALGQSRQALSTIDAALGDARKAGLDGRAVPTCWNGAASCGRRPASCVWRWRMRANRSACSASATPPRKAPMRPRWRRATPPARRSCASAPWSTRIACRSWR
ncbi:hypothetical protein RLIN73S_00415 [Rhodanobacter lindaniclasticus]